MKLSKIFSLFTLLFFVSCSTSNLSKNQIEEKEFIIKNGTFKNRVFEEELIFKRNSWYHELTLQFDTMVTTLTPQSSFNLWFSKEELEYALKCSSFNVILAYSLDSKKIPYSLIYGQIEAQGYTRFDLIEFKNHLLAHPDSELNSLKLYHVFGICKKGDGAKPLNLSIPGFLEKNIN